MLNKKSGDVTIAYARTYSRKNITSFEKKAYPVKDISKNSFLTILFDIEEKELAIHFHSFVKDKNIRIAIIGKREITKINSHNFKTLNQMIEEKHKKFRQIVTANLVRELLNLHETISSNIVTNKYLNVLNDDIKVLEKYVKSYFVPLTTESLSAIYEVAKELNLFDFSIYHRYQNVKNNIDLLSFTKFVTEPNYRATDSEKLEYASFVNQFVLYKKLYGNKFENFELVEKRVEIKVPEKELELELEIDSLPY